MGQITVSVKPLPIKSPQTRYQASCLCLVAVSHSLTGGIGPEKQSFGVPGILCIQKQQEQGHIFTDPAFFPLLDCGLQSPRAVTVAGPCFIQVTDLWYGSRTIAPYRHLNI